MVTSTHVKELTLAELDDIYDKAWHKLLAIVRIENFALIARTMGCAEIVHRDLVAMGVANPQRHLYETLLGIIGVHNMRQSSIEIAIGHR